MNKQLLAGAIGGFVATGPMTLTMLGLHQLLPPAQQTDLPPQQVTENIAADLNVRPYLEHEQLTALAWINHFVYGTALGMLYGALVAQRRQSPLLKGNLYGLGVWAANYIGLLPTMGLLRSAFQRPAKRTATIIAAHLVWGSMLGLVVERLQR